MKLAEQVDKAIERWELARLEIVALHEQRDELAEALRELLACSMPTGEDTRTDRAMAKASAALAKVKGAA